MAFLIRLLIHVVVFGVALAFATRQVKNVKVEPRAALPLVALVFAILNALLYDLLKFTLNLVTLWSLFLIVPFVVNVALLWLTDKLARPLKIEGIAALLYASGIMTVAHVLLRIAHV